MSQWVQAFCFYVVIGMGIGGCLLVSAWLYSKAFEQIIEIAGVKKELIDFVWSKYRKQEVVRPKIH